MVFSDRRRAQGLACAVIVAISALGCGGGGDSSASGPSTSPTAPPVDVVNLAGNWVGTIESANLPPQTISAVVVQFADCVDGSWKSADGDWTGAISGFARTSSFSGQMTFERRSNGGCLASGNVGGDVGADSLRWIGVGASPVGVCAGNLPQSLVINLRRQ